MPVPLLHCAPAPRFAPHTFWPFRAGPHCDARHRLAASRSGMTPQRLATHCFIEQRADQRRARIIPCTKTSSSSWHTPSRPGGITFAALRARAWPTGAQATLGPFLHHTKMSQRQARCADAFADFHIDSNGYADSCSPVFGNSTLTSRWQMRCRVPGLQAVLLCPPSYSDVILDSPPVPAHPNPGLRMQPLSPPPCASPSAFARCCAPSVRVQHSLVSASGYGHLLRLGACRYEGLRKRSCT